MKLRPFSGAIIAAAISRGAPSLSRKDGGGGIRTHGTFKAHTRFPSVLLQPLGHSSRRWIPRYKLGDFRGH